MRVKDCLLYLILLIFENSRLEVQGVQNSSSTDCLPLGAGKIFNLPFKPRYLLLLNHKTALNFDSFPKLNSGGVAQMVERSFSMREVPGSLPGASNQYFLILIVHNNIFIINIILFIGTRH